MGAENPSVGFGCSVAVIVGIDKYTHIRHLNTAVNDATRLAALLRAEHGYTNVITLTEEVTRERLCDLLTDELPGQIGPNDRLLFYFAGHGIALDGEDGPEGYLIPQDARSDDRNTFLAMADLYGCLNVLPCRHLLAIFDCCFAGAFNWHRRRNVRPIEDMLYREHYDRFVREPAWQILTSTAYDQEALDVLGGRVIGERGEHGKDTSHHSPFACALFEALAGAGDLIPKGGGDGVVTATELYLYLRQAVEVQAETQANHAQTPELWPFSRQKHGKGEYIFLVPGRGEPALPTAPPLSDENNPYRGLEPYNEEHAPLFFGRAGQVQQLAGQVATHSLTVVLGASGTGKSSLVKAGLLPMLRQQAEASLSTNGHDTATLFILPPFRPGDAPLHVFAEQLTTHLGEPTQSEPTAIAQRIGRWLAAHPKQTLLLVVDQCEELITLSQSDDDRNAFLTALSSLLAQHAGRLRLILTLRTDFEPQFANTSLTPHWQAARFVVTPLSQSELREVIELPAAQRVLFFDPPELVDRLIDEVIQAPGALPLLSFTLSELYRAYLQRQEQAQLADTLVERTLTEADYRVLGGVIGSLRTRANAIFDNLDEVHRATMQRVMLRMVAVEGGELARRRVPRSELEYASEEENQRVATVLQQMIDARLLVTGSTDTDGDGAGNETIEPAHDALVRAWDKLLLWKRIADEYLPLQRRLTLAANEWAQADEKAKTGLLWNNNPRLPQVQGVLTSANRQPLNQTATLVTSVHQLLWPSVQFSRQPTWLNGVETEFVRQSLLQRATVWRRLIGGTLGVVLTLTALLIFAEGQRREAVVQRDNALERLSSQLASQSRLIGTQNRPQQQLLVVLEAINVLQSQGKALLPLVQSSLHDALAAAGGLGLGGHQSTVTALAFSPNGAWLASADQDGFIVLRRLADPGAPPLKFQSQRDSINNLLFTSDSAYLLAAGSDGVIRRWAMHDLEAKAMMLQGHLMDVLDIALSPDGRWLVSVGFDGTLRLWSLEHFDTAPTIWPLGPVYHSAQVTTFSPDGQWLAATGGEAVKLWALHDLDAPPRLIKQATPDGASINGVEFSPDSTLLALSESEGAIRLYHLEQNTITATLQAHQTAVRKMAFSPDGQWFGSVADEQTGYLWNLQSLELPALTLPHGNTTTDLVFSPDNRWVASAGSQDALIQLWDLHNLEADPIRFHGNESLISAISFSPDSSWIASAGGDGLVRLWPVQAPTTDPRTLVGHTGSVDAVAVDPTGTWLATAGFDHTVRLWRTSDLTVPPRLLAGHTDGVKTLMFSPDGHWLASGGSDNQVLVWDIWQADAAPRALTEHRNRVGALAFSHDGSTLITAGGGQLHFWDVARLQLIRTYEDEDEVQVNSLVFSPDDRWLALAGVNHAMRLWDLTAPATKPQILRSAPDNRGTDTAFSPDGWWLFGSTWPGTDVWIWDMQDLAAPPKILDDFTNAPDEIAISADGRWLATSGSYAVQLWNLQDLNAHPVVLQDHRAWTTGIAFAPDTSWLLSGSSDRTAKVWSLSLPDLLARACQTAGRNLTLDEWEQYFLDEPYRKTCPDHPIHHTVTRDYFFQAYRLIARENDLDGALAQLQQAKQIDPDLAIEPKVEVRRLADEVAADQLTTQASNLAADGQVEEAAEKFRAARQLDPLLVFNPMVQAMQLAKRTLLDQARTAAKTGEVETALQIYADFAALELTYLVDASAWNNLCWWGSLYGYAARVLEGCEQAVALADAEDLPNYRDSRGLARALTGDLAGAIADFTVYVESKQDNGQYEPDGKQRTAWIAALERGEDPFDAATLQSLREG